MVGKRTRWTLASLFLVPSGQDTACCGLRCSFGYIGVQGGQRRAVAVGEWAELRFPVSVVRDSQKQFPPPGLGPGTGLDTPSLLSPVTSGGAELYASPLWMESSVRLGPDPGT